MKIKFLIVSIVLTPLFFSLASCSESEGSDTIGCDEQMLGFFDMEPSDGIGINCEMHLVKRKIQNPLSGVTVQYYLSNHCLDMIITPFDCDMQEVDLPWFAGDEFSEEIIGVQL